MIINLQFTFGLELGTVNLIDCGCNTKLGGVLLIIYFRTLINMKFSLIDFFDIPLQRFVGVNEFSLI